MILIIGSSGYIGKHLFKYFSEKQEVIGTYFNNKVDGMIQFNLENPDISQLGNLENVKYAIICSSLCNIDECKRDEEKAYKINVNGTKKLIEQLFEKNIIPIFLSTNYVYDGEKGDYIEEDERNPQTNYGKHKKIIEDFLIESGKEFLIFRLNKVYGLTPGDGTLLTSLIEQLPEKEENKYATDQIFSAIYVGDVVKVIGLCMERNLTGVFNLSPKEKFSWFELAINIKNEFKLNNTKIEKCSIKDIGFFENNRPLKINFNPEKVNRELGFEFSTVKENIEKLKKDYNVK
tara:strand:- start:535 stop:1404 length:870 start_codon:yes stop_codon:yes gene_type:complete